MNKNRNLSSPSVVTKSLSDLSSQSSASSSKFIWGGKPATRKSTVIPPINNKTLFKSNVTHLSLEKLDPLMYTDIESRGLVSRIVKYHDSSQIKNEKIPFKNVYTKPGQFPIVHLKKNHLVNSPKRTNTTMVKIAPPDKSIYQAHTRSTILRMGSAVSKQDPELNKFEKSDIEHLKEISRKRINNDDLDTERNKKHCKEKSDQVDNTTKAGGLSGKTLANDNFTATKRQRESRTSPSSAGSSPTEINQLNKKRLCGAKNNDISSSLSSSMTIVNKQKINDNSILTNKNELIITTTPSVSSLNRKQIKSDLNISLNENFDQTQQPQQQILITQTPATTSAITLNKEHLLKNINDNNIILNNNNKNNKLNDNNYLNKNNNNQLVKEVATVQPQQHQQPRLTLFNKKYDLNINTNNKNNNIDKNILLSSDNDYENDISFIKPKIKAPVLLGSDKELVKRVEKDKLSLMLSCLSGDFDDDDDDDDRIPAVIFQSQSISILNDVTDNNEKTLQINTSIVVPVATQTPVAIAIPTAAAVVVSETSTITTPITTNVVTTTPTLSGFQLINPQINIPAAQDLVKTNLINNSEKANDLSNQIVEKPNEFKLNDESSLPKITTASDFAVKPVTQFNAGANLNNISAIPSLGATSNVLPTAAIAPQPATINFNTTKTSAAFSLTTKTTETPRIGGFCFAPTNSTTTPNKTSPVNKPAQPMFGNLNANTNNSGIGFTGASGVGIAQSPITFTSTSSSPATSAAPNVNPFGKSNSFGFGSKTEPQPASIPNTQATSNAPSMFQFGETKVNHNVPAVVPAAKTTTNTFGAAVSSPAAPSLFNFGQQQPSTNLFSNDPAKSLTTKSPTSTGFSMPSTNTFGGFGDKSKEPSANNTFSFGNNNTPTMGNPLAKSNVVNFSATNANSTPAAVTASPVFGKFGGMANVAGGDKANSGTSPFAFSQNNENNSSLYKNIGAPSTDAHSFNAFNKSTTPTQGITTGSVTNAPVFSFGNTAKSPQFGMPTGHQQPQQHQPAQTTGVGSSIFGGQISTSFSFGQSNSTPVTTAPSTRNPTSQASNAFNFGGNTTEGNQLSVQHFGSISKNATGTTNSNLFNPEQPKKDFSFGGSATGVELSKPSFNFGGSGTGSISSGITQSNTNNNNNSQPQTGTFNFSSSLGQSNSNNIVFGGHNGADKNKSMFGDTVKPFSFSGSNTSNNNNNNNETTIMPQPALTMGASSAFNFSAGNNLNNTTNNTSSSPFAFGNTNLATSNQATFGGAPPQNNLFSIGPGSGGAQTRTDRKIRTAARRLNK